MLEFTIGIFIGIAATFATAFLWGRTERAALLRSRNRRYADFQRAVLDVQDAVAMGLSADTCAQLRAARDQALSAYLAAMGE